VPALAAHQACDAHVAPHFDHALDDVDFDLLVAAHRDAELRPQDHDLVLLRANHERVAGTSRRHAEPDCAFLDARVAAIDAHHARSFQPGLDPAVQRDAAPFGGRSDRVARCTTVA
jgi:hypothetical protein